MHHKDHNVHRCGFRFDNRDLSRHTFNALPFIRWLAVVLAALFALGLFGVHPS